MAAMTEIMEGKNCGLSVFCNINTSAGQDYDGLSVQVDIARCNFSGTISTTAAFDPEGQRMRTQPS